MEPLGEGESTGIAVEEVGEKTTGAGNEKLTPLGSETGEERVAGSLKEAEEFILGGGDAIEDTTILKDGDEIGFLAAEKLIGAEEEGLVGAQGAAESGARLQAGEGALARIEVVSGLNRAMAKEAEGIAVELVCTALGNDVDHAAEGIAKFGGEGVAVHLEFLNGFLADRGPYAATRVVVVFEAIDKEAIATPVGAAKGQAGVGRLDGAVGGIIDKRGSFDNAGSQQGEVEEVPAVDGEIVDANLLDGIGLLSARDLDGGQIGGNDDL